MSILSFMKRDRRNRTTEFRRLYGRLLAQDILMSLPYVGMWVKNSRFELLEISEQASLILYDKLSNQCVGLTDYQIARDCGSEMSEEQFAHVCRGSDLYLKDDLPKTFIELITDIKGKPRVWKTIKSKVYMGDDFYYFGFATFLDIMMGGYDQAYFSFEKDLPKLKKLNNNLYVYKENL